MRLGIRSTYGLARFCDHVDRCIPGQRTLRALRRVDPPVVNKMDLLQTVRKEGSRGGRAEFSWDNVKTDAQRENYLGHSVMARKSS